MALISASRMNSLKARVKAECQRRSQTNSVATYGGTSYDYTTVPATGVLVTKEHRDKNAVPLNAINSDTISGANTQTLVTDSDVTAMEAFVTVLEKRALTDDTASDCKGSCAGACYSCTGSCASGCSSCTGTCTGTCKGGCQGCSSDCKTECNWCDNTCYATCMDWC